MCSNAEIMSEMTLDHEETGRHDKHESTEDAAIVRKDIYKYKYDTDTILKSSQKKLRLRSNLLEYNMVDLIIICNKS